VSRTSATGNQSDCRHHR
jgi:transposase